MIHKKERSLWIAIVIILCLFLINPLPKASASSSGSEKMLHIFHEVMGIVQTDYVKKIDEEKLYKGAIDGILASLGDPHSRYLSEDTFKELQSETRGSFGGL